MLMRRRSVEANIRLRRISATESYLPKTKNYTFIALASAKLYLCQLLTVTRNLDTVHD